MFTRTKLWRFSISLVALALLAATSTNTPQADPTRYLTDVKALASPEMEGRGAGSKGLSRAQHLIENRHSFVRVSTVQPLTKKESYGAHRKVSNEVEQRVFCWASYEVSSCTVF